MNQDKKIQYKLEQLSHSKFRSSFYLKQKDILYIQTKGIATIKQHAYDFITTRLAPAHLQNDGKQTPMRGHPVFIGQHATGTCCRGCLEKWHQIPKGKPLTNEEIDYVVKVIMSWIANEMRTR